MHYEGFKYFCREEVMASVLKWLEVTWGMEGEGRVQMVSRGASASRHCA